MLGMNFIGRNHGSRSTRCRPKRVGLIALIITGSIPNKARQQNGQLEETPHRRTQLSRTPIAIVMQFVGSLFRSFEVHGGRLGLIPNYYSSEPSRSRTGH